MRITKRNVSSHLGTDGWGWGWDEDWSWDDGGCWWW
jgi:hypothetical protein